MISAINIAHSTPKDEKPKNDLSRFNSKSKYFEYRALTYHPTLPFEGWYDTVLLKAIEYMYKKMF